ncbi:MAG: PEP-CTERM sorting domain-containing protein [Burkholderiales bacterium]|jgi:hypothetical protein|nr:MAG: PEP-CTERM sorting domain-containing protein [Burkholderiales bacterium]
MKLLTVTAALAALALPAVATTTLNAGPYSVTYNETTPGFGSISALGSGASSVSFEWSVNPVVNVSSVGGAPVSATFAIPDFTISVNPGYTLSGAISASLGNITYFLLGSNATASITTTGKVSIDGAAPVTIAPTALPVTVVTPTFGYFAGSGSYSVAGFSTASLSAASITLSASGGNFVSIGAQPQNKLRFEFTATPVPEPSVYALMLAGLGVLGLRTRRRQQA